MGFACAIGIIAVSCGSSLVVMVYPVKQLTNIWRQGIMGKVFLSKPEA
jgi:hypothetical protein